MHLERLVIESGERTLTAEFGTSLTVVEGLGDAARQAFVGELLGAFSGTRPGVHLELTSEGHHLTVFRPRNGKHRVIDTDSARDVTDAFTAGREGIDLFAALGVDPALARQAIHFTADDLRLRAESDAWIAALAGLPQADVWNAAMRLASAQDLVDRQAAETGTSPGDAALLARIEERHAELVAATATYERVRLLALTVGTLSAMGGLAIGELAPRFAALPFLALAVAGVVLALRYRAQRTKAERAEHNVLREAGADDYTSFQYARIDTMLDTDVERRRFMSALGDLHRAQETWDELVGPIPVRFALDHEPQVNDAVRNGAIVRQRRASETGAAADDTTEIVQAVLARLEAVRALTSADPLPLVLDDPFTGLDGMTKQALLELMLRNAGSLQVIVVSGDADVRAWARSTAGHGGLVSTTTPAIAVRTSVAV